MNQLQKEFWLRAAKAFCQLLAFYFFWWAVIWEETFWQKPFELTNQTQLSNMAGLALSLSLWIFFDHVLAHPEILQRITLPKRHRKAAPETTEKEEDEERQPIY